MKSSNGKTEKEPENWPNVTWRSVGLGLEVALATFSPEAAQDVVEKGDNTREWRPDWVNRIATAIDEGRFDPANGQTILFDQRMRLVDGQHRLLACIMSGKPITLLVVRGVRSVTYVGIGKPRTDVQELQGRGYKNCADLAAVAKLYHLYKNGLPLLYAGWGSYVPDRGTVAEIVEQRPSLVDSVALCIRARQIGMSCSRLAVIHNIGLDMDKELADSFVEGVVTGHDLNPTDGPWLLRERMLKGRVRGEQRITPQESMALTIRAWNIWVTDEPVTKLSLPRSARDGLSRDNFPVLVTDPALRKRSPRTGPERQQLRREILRLAGSAR